MPNNAPRPVHPSLRDANEDDILSNDRTTKFDPLHCPWAESLNPLQRALSWINVNSMHELRLVMGTLIFACILLVGGLRVADALDNTEAETRATIAQEYDRGYDVGYDQGFRDAQPLPLEAPPAFKNVSIFLGNDKFLKLTPSMHDNVLCHRITGSKATCDAEKHWDILQEILTKEQIASLEKDVLANTGVDSAWSFSQARKSDKQQSYTNKGTEVTVVNP